MQKNIRRMLLAVPITFLLCFSLIGINVQAKEVDNENTTVTTTNEDEDNTTNSTSTATTKTNGTSTTTTSGNSSTNTTKTNGTSITTTTNTNGTSTTNTTKTSSTSTTQSTKTGPSIAGPSPSDSNGGLNSTTENETTETQEEKLPAWKSIDGKLHYVTEDGIVKKTGWFKEKDENPDADNDNEYYLDKNYAAVIGWNKINGNWYYFNELGVKQTGWILNEYSWYHLNESGIMEKGWIKDDGYKFYLNDEGKMVSGKKYIDNQLYFFDGAGKLRSGFYYDNGKKYYSTKEGVMVANKWITASGKSYYVKADSSVAVGDLIIDGKMESFDENGRYQGSGKMTNNLFLKFLNVGDADCAYIKLPNGETVLIDTGDVKTSDELVSFLNKQDLNEENGKPVIDYVVLTHGHSDHIGGLISVLKNFKVKKIYMPEIAEMKDWYSDADVTKENSESIELLKADYKIYNDTMDYLKKNDIEVTNTVRGQFIDKEHILQFIQSDKNFGSIGAEKLTGYYWGLNDNSAIVYLNYADLQTLFTGDMEWTSEKDFVTNNLLNGQEVDILKVPHHGHNTSSTSDFIQYVKPDLGVISRSAGSINTETLKAESVDGNSAYKNLLTNGVSIYETSEKDGVSVYATQENWNLEN